MSMLGLDIVIIEIPLNCNHSQHKQSIPNLFYYSIVYCHYNDAILSVYDHEFYLQGEKDQQLLLPMVPIKRIGSYRKYF